MTFLGTASSSLRQGDRLLPTVGLKIADDDIDATAPELVGFRQHLVGLADACGVAEKHPQPAASSGVAGPRAPRSLSHWGNTRTSMPSASRISRSSGVPPRRPRQVRRRL